MAKEPRDARREAEARVAAAWKSFYATPEGRMAVADLLTHCNIYQLLETNDPYEAQRLLGERNVALRIVQMIGLKPAEAPVDAWEDADILDRMIKGGR